MSFILDALRKSETDRQQQAGGEFSSVPSSSGESQSPKWLWMLALLLLVNIAILLGILLRPDTGPDAETPPTAAPEPVETMPAAAEPVPQEEAAVAAEPSFEDRIAEAKENQPAPEAVTGETAQPAADEPAPAIVPAQERLMSIDELRLAGAIQLPELHLDIHVYADEPTERFVFVNMNKYREGSQLDEGPVVTEITADGVVLQHQGQKFLVPRE